MSRYFLELVIIYDIVLRVSFDGFRESIIEWQGNQNDKTVQADTIYRR